MEFINCGDQYCLPCLERYVEYWIKEGSWGLLPVELACPVCGSNMLDDDWMPYVSGKVMNMWNKFQLKRKEIIKKLEINRSCPICNHSQPLIGSNHKSISDLIMIGDCLITNLDKTSYESWRTIFGLEHVVELFKEKNLMDFTDFIESCQDLFDEFLNLIEKLKEFGFFKVEEQDLIKLLMEFGRTFLYLISNELEDELEEELDEGLDEGLEEGLGGISVNGTSASASVSASASASTSTSTSTSGVSEIGFAFIDMQLNFQSIFPFGHCDSCNLDFCLPCQFPTWFHHNHPKSSANTRPDGSKQCPRCFVAIEKDPDGCNEMRCNYCGMKFCWECGRKWSKECGIYACKQQRSDDGYGDEEIPRSEMASSSSSSSSSSTTAIVYNSRDPEIGVPNVHLIHNNNI